MFLKHLFHVLFLFGGVLSMWGQQDTISPRAAQPEQRGLAKMLGKARDTSENAEAKQLTIANYKIINHYRDTVYLDTSLTIQKEFRYNYLRQDDFELMPFSNVGQPYNSLGVSFQEENFYPKLGARARHFGYFESEDISYYNVATPMTELFFKTILEQGQLLDAKLTFNTSERLNFSLAFIGLRSLGKYQIDQARSGRFRSTFNYVTKNERYMIRGHYAAQDLDGEENGGLADKEVQFESGDEDFIDRRRVDVVFQNARNNVVGKRYFLDQQFNLLLPRKDSVKTRSTLLAIGHQFNYETKFYQFNQTTTSTRFGEDVLEAPIDDKASLRTMFNQLSANISNKTLGRITGRLNFYNYDYSFRSLMILPEPQGAIPNRLQGDEIAIGGDYSNAIGPLKINGKVRYNVVGDLSGTLFDASAQYAINENNSVFGSIYGSSRLPNFNFLLYQSDYGTFNWFNFNEYEKQRVQNIEAGFASKLLGKLTVNYSVLDNYTYFGLDDNAVTEAEASLIEGQTIDETLLSFVRPFQASGSINHLKVKYEKEFKWRKWALNNTVMYQNVTQEAQVLNVPDLVTRNTLYFSSDIFKKAMFIQTGATFKYFTTYNMNAYHPLLAEFFVQNREELGAYPLIDVFINARVRQTRIYLKAEHLNTVWDKQYNYYSAPNYPYRDFVIRFGLVWNFFS
ncbi:MAG: putative porin [Croceivirga sp.]